MPRRLPNLKSTLQRFKRKPEEIQEIQEKERKFLDDYINERIDYWLDWVSHNDTRDTLDYLYSMGSYIHDIVIGSTHEITENNVTEALENDIIRYIVCFHFMRERGFFKNDHEMTVHLKNVTRRLNLYQRIAATDLDRHRKYKQSLENIFRTYKFMELPLKEEHTRKDNYFKALARLKLKYINLPQTDANINRIIQENNFELPDNTNFEIVYTISVLLNRLNTLSKSKIEYNDLIRYWNSFSDDLLLKITIKEQPQPRQRETLFQPRERQPFENLIDDPFEYVRNVPQPTKKRGFTLRRKKPSKEQVYLKKMENLVKTWEFKNSDEKFIINEFGNHATYLHDRLKLYPNEYQEPNPSTARYQTWKKRHLKYVKQYSIQDLDKIDEISEWLTDIVNKGVFLRNISNYFLVLTEHIFVYNFLHVFIRDPIQHYAQDRINNERGYIITTIIKQLYFICRLVVSMDIINIVSPIQLEKIYIIILILDLMIKNVYKTFFMDLYSVYYNTDNNPIRQTSLKQWIPIIFQLDNRQEVSIFKEYDSSIRLNNTLQEALLSTIVQANKESHWFPKKDRDADDDEDEYDVPF